MAADHPAGDYFAGHDWPAFPPCRIPAGEIHRALEALTDEVVNAALSTLTDTDEPAGEDEDDD